MIFTKWVHHYFRIFLVFYDFNISIFTQYEEREREIFTPDQKILITYTDHPTKKFDQKIIFLEVIGIFKKTVGVLVVFYFHTVLVFFSAIVVYSFDTTFYPDFEKKHMGKYKSVY